MIKTNKEPIGSEVRIVGGVGPRRPCEVDLTTVSRSSLLRFNSNVYTYTCACATVVVRTRRREEHASARMRDRVLMRARSYK